MSEFKLPGKLQLGAQLGLGVRSGGMYTSGQKNSNDGQTKWVDCFDDSFVCDLSKLRISEERNVFGHLCPDTISEAHQDNGNEFIESDIDNDFDDDEVYERWRNLLLMKLNWSPIAPEIPANFQPMKDVECNSDHMYAVRDSTNKSVGDYVPGGLITNLEDNSILPRDARETDQRQQDTLYDPTVSDLFMIGSIQTPSDLRNGNDQHYVMAFCSGGTKSVLTLAVLKGRPEDRSEASRNPETGDPITIDLKAMIKCIKFPVLSPLLGRNSDCIGIISEYSLHVVKIDNIDSHSFQISSFLVEAMPFSEFGDFPFADFAFNPWDLHQFAVVDIKGNFGVGRIPKNFKHGNKIRFSKELSGTIFDPEELSGWKRIEWSSSHDRLLVMDRSKMIELNFEQGWQLEVIQAKTWSTIRDYKRVDDDFGVVLTSSEIIIIRTADDADCISREISWKHDLDPKDPTLRITLQKIEYDDKTSVVTCIFSKFHSHIYIHGFSIDKNRLLLRSTRDSSILQISNKFDNLIDICFMECNQMTSNYGISGNSYQKQTNLHILVHGSDNGNFFHVILSDLEHVPSKEKRHVHFEDLETATEKTRLDQGIVKVNRQLGSINEFIRNMMLNLRHKQPVTNKADDELLQSYGYKLSERINDLIETWDNAASRLLDLQPLLKDLVEVPQDFDNLEEFSSFLKQLFDYYREQDISFTNISTVSNMLLYEEVEDLEIFYSKLLQCWDLVTQDSESLSRKVMQSLIWSAIRLCKPSKYEEKSRQLVESLTEPYAHILGCWEDNYQADNFPATSSAFPFGMSSQLSVSSQAQIPTIKSSQPRVSKRVRGGSGFSSGRISKASGNVSPQRREPEQLFAQALPNALPDSMTPSFTLVQPLSTLDSQSQSSQRSKRKKKRIGGFG